LDGTARELLADAERQDDGAGGDAVVFLRELLAQGPQAAKDIYRDAEAAGYSRDAMKRAKARIGAEAVKQSMSGGWVWILPEPEGSKTSLEGREESGQRSVLPSHSSANSPLPSEASTAVPPLLYEQQAGKVYF
jgi:hypothetical protein